LSIYDLSLPVSAATVTWRGDPLVRLEPRRRIAQGDACNVSELRMGSHTGTHVDPPYHFVEDGVKVDALPLDVLMGRAWVCDLGSVRQVDAGDLQSRVPPGTTRLLLKTANSALWHREGQGFTEDFVDLTPEAARWVVAQGVRLLGVDYLSVERPGPAGNPVHRTLLEAGVIIVEGLDLACLTDGWYNVYCLPLKLAGGDGAPARAVAVGPLE